jgi:hypothetical protein
MGNQMTQMVTKLDPEAGANIARWRVHIIRHPAEHLCTVRAANEQDAIEKAAERFEIAPEQQNRIVVQKASGGI